MRLLRGRRLDVDARREVLVRDQLSLQAQVDQRSTALMHGEYAAKTPVAWRLRIQRKPNSSGNFNNYFTSNYQQTTANETIPAYAGHGFSRRTWYAPNNPAGYRYRVILDLI